MRNIQLTIEYDGTDYAGWQVQKSKIQNPKSKTETIQETLEKALQKILQEKIKVIGSGRTDAGVHALAQVANFKTKSGIDLKKLQRALNGNLPEDITINRIEEVDLDFHSRFQAKSKVYRYSILNRCYPSALLKDRVYFYPYPLDLKLMQKEAGILLGRHNFAAFQASGSKEGNPVRTIKKLKIHKDKHLICIDLEAEGFLYHMVRNIIGTLLEIGRGKFAPESLKKILRSRNRRLAGPTVPAHGLCLLKVKY